MREEPPELGVVLAVGPYDGQVLRVRVGVVGWVFFVLRHAVAVAVDVLPCLRVGVHQLVGGDPHDRAIFLVEGVDVEGQIAFERVVLGPENGGSGIPRAWVLAERVEEEVVEDYG